LVITGSFATTIPILLSTTNQAAIQLQKLFLVSIAFKLVQKNNALNRLFKIAVASLSDIINLFLLWGVLFLTWAILLVEVFSLTRWMSAETHNQNFASFGKALLMLAFFSTGEGWNQYMHDYTVADPLCSDSTNFLLSDCGSPSWAFVLFVTWNVLSMYIFVNMFTGVVVENFGSVSNKKSRIGREEMRQFKKVWSDFDLNRTGYIRRRDYVAFFARLSGVFEVKIYPTEYSIPVLVRSSTADQSSNRRHVVDGLDLDALSSNLKSIDVNEIRKRRHLYNRLYHEAIMSDEPRKGISFTNMLLLLAHYKLLDVDNAMQLEELLQRKARMARIEDLTNLDRIRGLIRTIYLRKRFLRHRDELRRAETDVPAIFVQTSDASSPPRSPRLQSVSPTPEAGHSPPGSPIRDSPRSPMVSTPSSGRLSPKGSPGEISSFFWPSPGSPTRDGSQEVDLVAGLGASAWGDLMSEALAEDERHDKIP